MARSPDETDEVGLSGMTDKRKLKKPTFDSKISLTVNKMHLNEAPHQIEDRYVAQPILQKALQKNNNDVRNPDILKRSDMKKKSRKDLSLQDLIEKVSVQELGQRLLQNQINEQSSRVSIHEWNKETARSSEFEFDDTIPSGATKTRRNEQNQP